MHTLAGLLAILVAAPTPSPIPDATPSKRGVVNTTTQSLGGLKTFVDGGVRAESLTVLSNSSDAGFDVLTEARENLTLYVDPTGNDSGPCVSSGTGACATLAGVINKLPNATAFAITINIATGTYAAPFDFQPRLLLARGATLSVVGTLVASTLASGSASGTTTGSTGGTQSGPCSVTDSAQTWTTNDLRGRMVTFASGALSGQTHPITSNTSTSFTISNIIAPGTGIAYSIVEPGVVFNGGTTSARIANLIGPGTASFSNIHITRGAGQTGVMQAVVEAPNITFTNVKITNHSSNSFTMQVVGGRASFTRSIVQSVSSSAALNFTSLGGVPNPTGSVTSSFVTATSNGGIVATDWSGPSLSSVVVEGGGTTVGAVSLNGNSLRAFAASLWITCTGGGIGWSTGAVGSFISSTSLGSNGVLRIQNCGTGVLVQGPSYWVVNGITFDTVTTAASVLRGGTIDFLGGTPTFTGVTNELSLDGAISTFAALAALPAPQGITNVFGSKFIR